MSVLRFEFRASDFFRHSSLVIRICDKALCFPMAYEFPRPHRLSFRSHDSGRDRLLFAEAEARGEAGLQHAALAEVSLGNSSQRAVSKTAQELAPDPPTHPAGAGGPGVDSALFQDEHEAGRVARGDSG